MNIPSLELEKRWSKLSDILGDDQVLMVLSGRVLHRNQDTEHVFYQNSDFWYFTGIEEPDAAIFFEKRNGSLETYYFGREPDKLAEIWTGPVLDYKSAGKLLGVSYSDSFNNLKNKFKELFKDKKKVYIPKQYSHYPELLETAIESLQKLQVEYGETQDVTSLLRLYKSDWELSQIRQAASFSGEVYKKMFQTVSSLDKPTEANLLGLLVGGYYFNGCKEAYPAIVAAGENANILHYTKNDSVIKKDDLVLIDSAAEYNRYGVDISRTFPVGGKFSKPQSELYELVFDVQRQTIEYLQNAFDNELTLKNVDVFSRTLMTKKLFELKFFGNKSLDETLEMQLVNKYYPHSVGHFLGLDTHDLGSGRNTVLGPGMVFTIEPGLYIRSTYEEIEPVYRGIGIRIEDSIHLNKGFVEVLTEEVPVSLGDLEGLIG